MPPDPPHQVPAEAASGVGGREPRVADAWLPALLLGAVLLTLAELLVLNRKKAIFTGGFLVSDHQQIASLGEALLLVAALLASNAALAAVPLQALAWLGGRRGWSRAGTLAWAAPLAFAPALVLDALWYELAAYFGDAFDFFLLRTIGAGSTAEMLGQAWAHLGRLGWWVLALGGGVLAAYVLARVLSRPIGRLSRRLTIKGRALATGAFVVSAVALVAVAGQRSEATLAALRRLPATYLLLDAVARVTDWDGDGYGAFRLPADPDPHDPSVYPYALEIPGNGIDENGVFGDLPPAALLERRVPAAAPQLARRPHVLLLVLESFRADLVGTRTGGREVTPTLNRLAREGAAARKAYSHNGYTTTSLRAIFRGHPLAPAGPGTLIDDLAANGYQTACFSAQDESFGGMAEACGMNRADVLVDARDDRDRRISAFATAGSLTVPGAVTLGRLRAFLASREDERPLFLYANLQECHFPYHHEQMRPLVTDTPLERSAIAPSRAAAVRETYLNAAANADALVAEMLDLLRTALAPERGLAVVITADHGESLFDDGLLGHGTALTEAILRVPLIVHGLPAVVRDPMGLDDIRGMIMGALQVPEGGAEPVRPRRTDDSEKRVFVWVGSIGRPRRIGWIGVDHSLGIDLVTGHTRHDGGAWEPRREPASAGPGDRLRLGHYWEALQLLGEPDR